MYVPNNFVLFLHNCVAINSEDDSHTLEVIQEQYTHVNHFTQARLHPQIVECNHLRHNWGDQCIHLFRHQYDTHVHYLHTYRQC